ncbi:HutD family protein [Streptacidiphilus sp. N1-12]|uniref:HutD family protein n=2 Tax=Streptacidiphilus alkalitolerans TaxID=3342712 RepID=A0ABV6XC78_9ACTN
MRILRAADRPATAWKNGGGITREIASWPEDAGPDGFDWRISLAEVAAGGPFSAFPGVDRVITVVDGGGMELTVDGAAHRVAERYRPFGFAGDADTGCRLLDGPVSDFNVMTRRGRCAAGVEILRAPRPLPVPDDRTVLLLVLFEGRARLGSTVLDRHDALLTTATGGAGDASVDFDGGRGVAALVTLHDITGP